MEKQMYTDLQGALRLHTVITLLSLQRLRFLPFRTSLLTAQRAKYLR